MSGILWDPALETGDANIDGQHRELFRMVNDLRDACVESKGEDAVEGILQRLMTYVVTHFAAEESLMIRIGYPSVERQAHIAAHVALKDKAVSLADEYRRGSVATILPLAEFLFDWLRTHIRETDARLVTYAKGAAS